MDNIDNEIQDWINWKYHYMIEDHEKIYKRNLTQQEKNHIRAHVLSLAEDILENEYKE